VVVGVIRSLQFPEELSMSVTVNVRFWTA